MNFHELSPEKQQVFLNGVAIFENGGVDAVKNWLATNYEFDFAKSEDTAQAETYIRAFVDYVAEHGASNGADAAADASGRAALAAAQPYAEPTRLTFAKIALPLAALGIPVTPVGAESKAAFLPDWPTSATTDPNQIALWDRQYGKINCAAVATGRPDGVWFFEADSKEVLDRIKNDTGYELLDEVKTFLTRSRPGRGHVYFRNTPLALEMGNLPQTYVKGGDFSVRVRNQYVVAPGSIHPESKRPYECLTPGVTPAPAPDWFVQWLMNQRLKVKNKNGQDETIPVTESGKIPHGFIHGWAVSQAGRLRSMGCSIETLTSTLLDLVHTNCEPPIDDDKVRQVARSFERYKPQPDSTLPLDLNQQPDNGVIVPEFEEVELPTFNKAEYPTFPSYVMSGTSLYENFVKPVCERNSQRAEHFMWLPATALLLNYLGTKIQTKGEFASAPFNGSQYLVLIGKRGEAIKSSSVDDAMMYFNYIGILGHNGGGLKTAEGKTVVWTAGSAEGLGVDMQKTNCKNAILFYDELSQLTKKAGIDCSTLVSNLCTLYESKKFGNTLKKGNESYALDPNSYCFSLLSCSTDETFHELWSKMNGNDTGLDNRFMFVLQPEVIRKSPKVDVPYLENAVKTRFLIDKAIQQGVFEYDDITGHPKYLELVERGVRYAERAKKWALAIAIDLGLTSVDYECMDRGCDIVQYELAVKKYLKTFNAQTREAALQQTIRRLLEDARGHMLLWELKKKAKADSVGTTAWGQAFYGLQKAGIIRTIGKGTKSDPQVVQVLVRSDLEVEP